VNVDTAAARSRIAGAVETLDPGYFAMVMGTGIVSVGMRNHDLGTLSALLMWLTAASYAVLAALTVARAVAFPAALRSDFDDPRRGFRFFTFVELAQLAEQMTAVDMRALAVAYESAWSDDAALASQPEPSHR
jgi:tellurite resistance protein TehA-like permease